MLICNKYLVKIASSFRQYSTVSLSKTLKNPKCYEVDESIKKLIMYKLKYPYIAHHLLKEIELYVLESKEYESAWLSRKETSLKFNHICLLFWLLKNRLASKNDTNSNIYINSLDYLLDIFTKKAVMLYTDEHNQFIHDELMRAQRSLFLSLTDYFEHKNVLNRPLSDIVYDTWRIGRRGREHQ